MIVSAFMLFHKKQIKKQRYHDFFCENKNEKSGVCCPADTCWSELDHQYYHALPQFDDSHQQQLVGSNASMVGLEHQGTMHNHHHCQGEKKIVHFVNLSPGN